MLYLRYLVVAVSILLAGCSGSGGDVSTSSVATSDAGSLTVIVDTRADEDAWVQFQVAGVTLERADGLQTANLLRESQILTVGDPSGEPAGLRFAWAPVGRYEAMHLMLVPGSGVALDAAGNSLMVTSPLDIRIPITDGFEHSPTSASWLLVGHDVAPLTILGAAATWFPRMSARLEGAQVQFATELERSKAVVLASDTSGGALESLSSATFVASKVRGPASMYFKVTPSARCPAAATPSTRVATFIPHRRKIK